MESVGQILPCGRLKDGSMQIGMSQAVAGIKGTVFVVEETGTTSTLKVLEGNVTLQSKVSGKQAQVSAGQMISASASGLEAVQASWANIAAPTTRTFPETGKTVSGKFLDYWNTYGGLAQQAFPISEEMQEQSDTDGKTYTVQYFQRAVFEYHPELKGNENEVLLSLLGSFRYEQQYPAR